MRKEKLGQTGNMVLDVGTGNLCHVVTSSNLDYFMSLIYKGEQMPEYCNMLAGRKTGFDHV